MKIFSTYACSRGNGPLHGTGSKWIQSKNWTRSALCLHKTISLWNQSETDPNKSKTRPAFLPKLDLPILDPLQTDSRTVWCKHLDHFQMVLCKQKLIQSGLVCFRMVPVWTVTCKHSLIPGDITSKEKRNHY